MKTQHDNWPYVYKVHLLTPTRKYATVCGMNRIPNEGTLDKKIVTCQSCVSSIHHYDNKKSKVPEAYIQSGKDYRGDSKFYMLFVEERRAPVHKHSNLSSAKQEAERLAEQTGKTVYVLKPVAKVRKTGMEWRDV